MFAHTLTALCKSAAFVFVFLLCHNALAAYDVENLDRGVVAVPQGDKVFVSWRWLGHEPDNTGFHVYRNGARITISPITNKTNFLDSNGSPSAQYAVAAVINGQEQSASAPVSPWSDIAKRIAIQRPSGGTTPDGVSYTYSPNDASVADLDGDGQYEIVLKWDPSNAKDNAHSGYTGNVYIDAYELDGRQLWRLDLGRNVRAGAHYTQFIVYDLDSDGSAEVALRTSDGSIDGQGRVIGDANADYRRSNGYVLSGPEYLTIFSGETGAMLASTNYVPARGSVSSWGDNYGNRVDRFLAGLAWLDGEKPSLIMARGYYTRAVITAWDWRDGRLSQRWVADSNNSSHSALAGQGAHSLSVADADGDGKHEVIYGAATVDNDGSLMYSTELGHGDALHVGDLIPDRPGIEVYMVHESPSQYGSYGSEMHDARTGQIIWGASGENDDVGRGVSMDVDPRYFGAEAWATRGGGIFSPTGARISSTRPSRVNFGAWWDGDFGRELLDSNVIEKWDYNNSSSSVLLNGATWSVTSNNGTKATPALSADILGDWREEVLWRTSSNDALLLFTTNIESPHRLRTLMHDPQYRAAIAWQNVAYNQPPHPSFFLGFDMSAPPQLALNPVGSISLPASATLNASVNNSVVSLSWQVSNADVSTLEIYRDTDANPNGRSRIATLSASSTSYVDNSVESGQSYYYWLKVTEGNGNQFDSNAAEVLSPPTDVPTPTPIVTPIPTTPIPATPVPVTPVPTTPSPTASPDAVSCSYRVTNDWGSGFIAMIRVENNGNSAIDSWQLSWQYASAARVDNSWNVSLTGSNPYTASNVSWNGRVAPGEYAEFGIQVSGGDSSEIPPLTGMTCQ